MSRNMAYVVEIDAIESIDGADAIEVAKVGGWRVVVKKGEYSVGDKAVYCELDSWIPHELAPFLTQPGHEPKEYNGVKGQKLKSKKLRGVVSQGLLLPKPVGLMDAQVGDVLDTYFGIQKWEMPENAQLAGNAKGNFPSLVPKTDQERIQNLSRQLSSWTDDSDVLEWEVTEKLEGSSMTCFLGQDGFEVCSRNLSLKEDMNNTFWTVAIREQIKDKMIALNQWGLAIQGELVGPGVQGNIYNLKTHEFYVYDVYDTINSVYLGPNARKLVVESLGLKHVPVILQNGLVNHSIDELLELAEGKSVLNPNQEREGIVFKQHQDPSVSFKAISNKYLLKQKD